MRVGAGTEELAHQVAVGHTLLEKMATPLHVNFAMHCNVDAFRDAQQELKGRRPWLMRERSHVRLVGRETKRQHTSR